MATLIDATYFFGTIDIGQKSDTNVSSQLTKFIESYEDEILTDILGYDLYKKFKTGIAGSDIKYVSIKDGKEYTNRNSIFTKWRGLIYTVGTTKKSLIANYVYWNWMLYKSIANTGSGAKVLKSENADEVSPSHLMVSAWNEMIIQIKELCEFLLSNPVDYPEFTVQYSRMKSKYLSYQNVLGI